MKKNMMKMAFGMMVMLMLGATSGFAAMSANYDDDDRGTEVKQTEAEKYAEKKPATRQAGKGVSFKETAARQLARLDARTSFAESLSAAIRSAARNVYEDMTVFAGDDESGQSISEGGEKQNTLSQSIAKEVIQNTVEVKKNTFYNKKTRKYTVYVCLEYNGDVKKMAQQAAEKAVEKARPRISESDRAKIEERMEKFQFEIEQELNKENELGDDVEDEE